jgi:hypothetical protein
LVAKDKRQDASDDPDDQGKYSDEVKGWGADHVFEYDVVEKEPKQLVKKISKIAQDNGLSQYSYNSAINCAIFSSTTTGQDLVDHHTVGANPNIDQLRDNVTDFILKNLPMLHGRVEYDNQEITKYNDEVIKCTFRYRRIFKGGIVLQSLSYVEIAVDENGKLLSVEIRWPRFQKIDQAQIALSLDNSLDLLNGRVQENDNKHGTINGISYAWVGIDGDNGKVILTPCFFFSSDVQSSGDKTEKDFIPVPLVQKYSQE